jgi:phospholipid transport system substrate-binding protein
LIVSGTGMFFSSIAAKGPMGEIQTTVDAIIDTIKNTSLSTEAKRQEISSLIRKRFDFRRMSQGALATNWKKASKEEKVEFVDLFTELLEATYLSRIEEYSDEKVEYLTEKIKGDRAVVDTVIVKNVNTPVQYRMKNKKGQWMVYDVLIEGVSLIRNYRTSYGEIVKSEGMKGLLARMEKKIDDIKSGKETEESK